MVRRRRRVLLVLLLSVVDDAFVVEKARFVVVDVDLRRVLRSVGLRVNRYNIHIYICINVEVVED